MTRRARVVVKSKTADMIRDWIDSHATKSQDDIAVETGFTRSNVLTMIKQGRTKMPLDKIGAFAKACGREPDALLRTALREYSPELARLVGNMQGVPMFDGADEIIDIFMSAMADVLNDAKEQYREENADGGEIAAKQAGRLNAEFDLSEGRRAELKKFIKNRLVRVTAGDDVIYPKPTKTN